LHFTDVGVSHFSVLHILSLVHDEMVPASNLPPYD